MPANTLSDTIPATVSTRYIGTNRYFGLERLPFFWGWMRTISHTVLLGDSIDPMPGTTPLPVETECFEKELLLAKYRAATSDYSRVLMLLSLKSDEMSKDEYTRLLDYSEKARGLAKAARAALDEHLLAHGCGGRVVS